MIACHMANDEALLECAIKNKKAGAVIRFYTTVYPALTVGRNQKITHEFIKSCEYSEVQIARRLTGGRAVPHFREITYCVVAPLKGIFSKGVVESFMIISERLAQGIKSAGVTADISRIERGDSGTVSCFDSVGRHEITVEGHKVLGSAQFRKSGYLLQQGTLVYRKLPSELETILNFKSASIEEATDRIPFWDETADKMFESVAGLFDETPAVRELDEEEKTFSANVFAKYAGLSSFNHAELEK